MMTNRRAVFIDRDGTIVKNFGNRPANTVEEIELLPGVPEGMRELKNAGLLLVLVTNQGGIGLGRMTLDVLRDMNERLNDLLVMAKAPPIDAFYWCPHRPDEGCECRKPNPGMIYRAQKDIGINLSKSYMIGDDARDMDAAVRAGIPWRLMVISDKYQNTSMASLVFSSFRDAAHSIAVMEKEKR